MAKRQFMVSAFTEDLDWVTQLLSKAPMGVEIKDFTLPSDAQGTRERAFEMWHIWREAVPADVPVILHAPFLDLIPGSMETEVVEIARKQHDEAMNVAEILKAKAVIFHSGFNPLVRGPSYRETFLSGTARYFSDLIERHPSTLLLIENMWEEEPQILLDLIDRVDHPHLKICLDVGHAQIYSKISPPDWLRKIGMRLGHVHINDTTGEWDQELALGQGKVPIPEVFQVLNDLGYFGFITIEMHGHSSVLKSIEYLNKHKLV